MHGIFLSFGFLMVLLSAGVALAEALPGSPTCEANFNVRMGARAWMEAQREIEMAGALILKPDSVLEYSCFYTRVSDFAGGVSFEDDLNKVMGDLLDDTTDDYIEANFGYISDNCGVMKQVWKNLKCQNYAQDYFMTFAEMVSGDPRVLPEPCENALRDEQWSVSQDVVFPEVPFDAADGGLDVVEALTIFEPDKCEDFAPVETGLSYKVGTEDVPEMVCVVAGCTYDGESQCVEEF